jgi:hypothetical protein
VEPHSHTICNGVGRGFVSVVLDQNNGFVVDGQPFCLSLSLQRRIDEQIIEKLRPNSSYNRPFCYLLRCVYAEYALSTMYNSRSEFCHIDIHLLHLHCHAEACTAIVIRFVALHHLGR